MGGGGVGGGVGPGGGGVGAGGGGTATRRETSEVADAKPCALTVACSRNDFPAALTGTYHEQRSVEPSADSTCDAGSGGWPATCARQLAFSAGALSKTCPGSLIRTAKLTE